MLAELRTEREHVDQAILVLQRIAARTGQTPWPTTSVDVAGHKPD